ncbi:MAG: hypothetical protein JO041_05945 [Acidobacteria bacterium]|nr:hypothetical protein [Acidobacteriota bacterium]
MLRSLAAAALAVTSALAAHAQAPAPAGSAAQIYEQLATVQIDAQQVYRIRDVSLDRRSIQVTFNDGSIAFTRDVQGKVTGAFFEGDANILISPPSTVERASLGLFTGAAILADEFSTAYLRFDGDVPGELKAGLRPFDDEDSRREFYSHAAPIAQNLAAADAMRLLVDFFTPQMHAAGEYLHLRIGGTPHGTYEVYYDPSRPEAVLVAQVAQARERAFLDVWTSYAPLAAAAHPVRASQPGGGLSEGLRDDEVAGIDPEDVEGDWLRVTDYKIRAQITPPSNLQADTLLTLRFAPQPTRLMIFELSRFLQISSVTEVTPEGEEPLEFLQNPAAHGSQRERRGNDIVAVVLPQPTLPNQRLQLRFRYSGDVLSDAGGGLLYVGARGTWFPNRGLSYAAFDMEFRYPPGWTLVATGTSVSETTQDGQQATHWIARQPIPTAGFNLGQYTRVAAKAGSVAVAAYASRSVERNFLRAQVPEVPQIEDNNSRPVAVRPPDMPPVPTEPIPAKHASNVAEDAAHAVDWLSAHIGPYPYSELWLTQVPGQVGQGWPGLIFLSSFAFLTPQERAAQHISDWNSLLYGKLMVPHETAHQWWGDNVGWRTYRDQWLSEALANYCALMILEQNSPADVRTVLEHYRERLLGKNADGTPIYMAGPVTLGPRLTSSKFPSGYDPVVYGRGTWLIHMLRNLLRDAPATPGKKVASGDELFLSALRQLGQAHRENVMSNEDVQRAFEAVLPAGMNYEGRRSLEWFFASWVNGTAIPRFELEDVKFSVRGEKAIVTARLLQKDAPEDFVSSVPIYASVSGGKPVLLGHVFTDGSETSVRFTAPAGARKLLIDPYQTILRQP